MAYIIFVENEIYGCYENIDILKTNLFIIVYKMYQDEEMSENDYNNMTDYLEGTDFTEHLHFGSLTFSFNW